MTVAYSASVLPTVTDTDIICMPVFEVATVLPNNEPMAVT